MITLYHYVHCPFCLRVRFALGYLDINYTSQVLPYHDEKTPLSLTGVKMLPILTIDKQAYNESDAIITLLDKQQKLNRNLIDNDLENMLSKLGSPIHNLCMPYWQFTQEFSLEAREYFQKKKELKRGPLYKLIQNKDQYLKELSPLLESIDEDLQPFFKSDSFTLADIYLASHLWGLYIFPEFQFSPKLHHYLQTVKAQCNFDYHVDYWKGDS
jgi:glutaredoxin 2